MKKAVVTQLLLLKEVMEEVVMQLQLLKEKQSLRMLDCQNLLHLEVVEEEEVEQRPPVPGLYLQ